MISASERKKLERFSNQSLRILTQRELTRAKIAKKLREDMPVNKGILSASYEPKSDEYKSFARTLFTKVKYDKSGVPSEAFSEFRFFVDNKLVNTSKAKYTGDPEIYAYSLRGKKSSKKSSKEFSMRNILTWMRTLTIKGKKTFYYSNNAKKRKNLKAGMLTSEVISKALRNQGKRNKYNLQVRSALTTAYLIRRSIIKKGLNRKPDWELKAKALARRSLNKAMKKWEEREYRKATEDINIKLVNETIKVISGKK